MFHKYWMKTDGEKTELYIDPEQQKGRDENRDVFISFTFVSYVEIELLVAAIVRKSSVQLADRSMSKIVNQSLN